MGGLRERFWELPLAQLSPEEWEALCDGCGRCCLHKVEDADTGEVEDTNVACQLLDTQTARCTDYANRKRKVPDCLRLTLKIVNRLDWLPNTCAYRLRANNRPLPDWHPLITGEADSAITAGKTIAGRVVSELEAGPLEHHIVEWEDEKREDELAVLDEGARA